MTIADRATRTTAARFVWGGLTLVFVLGLLAARSSRNAALSTEINDAKTNASTYANTTIAQAATVDGVGTVTFAPKAFTGSLRATVLTDPTVARVRVWDADGTLQASSDVKGGIGTVLATDDPGLAIAVTGGTSAQIAREPSSSSTVGGVPDGTELLQVFVPLRAANQVEPVGAVQIDFLHGSLVAASASPWTALSRLFAILAVACAAVFVVSMARRPLSPTEEEAAASPPPVVSSPTTDRGPAPEPALDEELQAAREQLRQATEAAAFLEAHAKDGAGTASVVADVEGATNRIAELERRMAEMSRAVPADAGAAPSANGSRPQPVAKREQVATSQSSDPNGLIAELEAQVAAAEARAKEAEDETLHRSPEAEELRARLARSAAKKKLGPAD